MAHGPAFMVPDAKRLSSIAFSMFLACRSNSNSSRLFACRFVIILPCIIWSPIGRVGSLVRLSTLPGARLSCSLYPNQPRSRRSHFATPTTPLERFGLQNASRNSVLTCAAFFSAYHVIKRSHFIIGRDGAPLTCEQGTAAQRIFAEAFQASADDSKLICKSAGRRVPIFEQL